MKTAQLGGNWFRNNSIILQTVSEYLVLVTKNAVFVRLVAFCKRLLQYNLRRRGRQVCTEAQINRVLKAMVECYRAVYGDEIVDIMLYGSYARGDYEQDSDVDIVAVVHGERVELQKKLRAVWDVSAELGLENDIVLSPTVIPYDEFVKYRQTLPYYRNIAREGRKIG